MLDNYRKNRTAQYTADHTKQSRWRSRVRVILLDLFCLLLLAGLICAYLYYDGVIDQLPWFADSRSEEGIEDTDGSAQWYPEYAGEAYAVINDNRPLLSEEEEARLSALCKEKQIAAEIRYSELDHLGRCGMAEAILGPETLPEEERSESLSSVTPVGWQTYQYDDLITDRYLYNRCHLIAYQLSGEGVNEKNLITGTRYLNVNGMLPFERMTASCIRKTGKHIWYRVTPVYEGKNLLAYGVLMEAMSIEDDGASICFSVFCYNVQPGIEIQYASGKSKRDGSTPEAHMVRPVNAGSYPSEYFETHFELP